MVSQTSWTPAEWQASTEPKKMLRSLAHLQDHRKWRLFACACARQIWHIVPTDGHDLVPLGEQCADGVLSEGERESAWHRYRLSPGTFNDLAGKAVLTAFRLARLCLVPNPQSVWDLVCENQAQASAWHATSLLPPHQLVRPTWQRTLAIMAEKQCEVVRDLFNPHFPEQVDGAWLNWNQGIVGKMARVIYDEQRFEDMPILADALEEAGCTERTILDHCRSGEDHRRGCWVVDWLLGHK